MNLIISYDDIYRRSVSTLVASTPSLSIKQCFSGDAYPTLLVEYSQKALRAAASKQDKPRPTSRSDAPSSSTSATKVCNFFRFNGWCRFGKFCVYKHDSGDRSSPSTARPLSDSVPDKKPNLATQQGKKEDSKNRDPKGDPDPAVFRDIDAGLSLGVDRLIAATGVFPEARSKRDINVAMEAFHLKAVKQNFSSVEAQPAICRGILEKEVGAGRMRRLSLDEAG
ncbi:hypothetical protein FOZ63_008141 [Perkinsus olseni]|uniref:C3H1-type domain-containing protein n=1 Tax=Perkinsus olseni TaxID=32597 RepID=A0A7J6SRK5_PEROL|nr:hypothetical protein FOZ63_008141 [Perkinsus olseni]